MGGTVTIRASKSNEPISPEEKAEYSIHSSEGPLSASAFDGAVYAGASADEGAHNHNLCAFLEARDLDCSAVWVVLADGSLVAVQSIDLF